MHLLRAALAGLGHRLSTLPMVYFFSTAFAPPTASATSSASSSGGGECKCDDEEFPEMRKFNDEVIRVWGYAFRPHAPFCVRASVPSATLSIA